MGERPKKSLSLEPGAIEALLPERGLGGELELLELSLLDMVAERERIRPDGLRKISKNEPQKFN